MMEYILICVIVSICIYVFAVYSKPQYIANHEGKYVEGFTRNSYKPKAPVAPGNVITQSGLPNARITSGEVTPPSGVGATAPIYIQNITARKVALGEELNIPAYGAEYLEVISNMTELMYRKSLKSCLQYVDDTTDAELHEMNTYMTAVDTLRKLSIWVNSNYEDPDQPPPPSGKLYGGDKGSSTWFG
jgi:hypothetical protein